jgi:alpha-mannosidase II
LVEFHIASPFVTVTDGDGITVPSQATPVFSWHASSPYHTIQPQCSTTKYRLLFKADVPPLGLSVYNIQAKSSAKESIGTTFAKIEMLTHSPFSVNMDDYPNKVVFGEPRDISIRLDDNSPGAAFNKLGLLKSISMDSNSAHVPVHLEFLKYGVRKSGQRSGAYLFLPDGPASSIQLGSPTVLVSKGEFIFDFFL